MIREYKVDGWKFDKRISYGHIATTIVVISTFVVWLMNIDTQVQLVKKDVLLIRDHDTKHEREELAARAKLEAHMDEQAKRIEGRMEVQYNEIIRRLEMLDKRLNKDD